MKNFIFKINRALAAKKTKLFTLFLAILASISFTHAIIIDGDFSDWNAVDGNSLTQSAVSDDSQYLSLHKIKFTSSVQNLFFYIEFAKDECFVFDILFNTDNNESTGYTANWPWSNMGADILIELAINAENNTWFQGAYQPIGNDGSWNWEQYSYYQTNAITVCPVVNLGNGKGV